MSETTVDDGRFPRRAHIPHPSSCISTRDPRAPVSDHINGVLAARGNSQSFSNGETVGRHLNSAERETSIDIA